MAGADAPGSWCANDAFTAAAYGPTIHGTVLIIVAGIPDGNTTARPGGIEARSETSMMWCRCVCRLVPRSPLLYDTELEVMS